MTGEFGFGGSRPHVVTVTRVTAFRQQVWHIEANLEPLCHWNADMTIRSIALTLAVIAGAAAATQAAAQTCQTITHTRTVRVCASNDAYKPHPCRVRLVTTTRRICMANPPSINKTPSLPRSGLTSRRSRS